MNRKFDGYDRKRIHARLTIMETIYPDLKAYVEALENIANEANNTLEAPYPDKNALHAALSVVDFMKPAKPVEESITQLKEALKPASAKRKDDPFTAMVKSADNNTVYTASLESVRAIAAEFGNMVLDHPEHGLFIVMDDLLVGGSIKSFERTPYGFHLAERYAVCLDELDEESELTLEELKAERRAEIELTKK